MSNNTGDKIGALFVGIIIGACWIIVMLVVNGYSMYQPTTRIDMIDERIIDTCGNATQVKVLTIYAQSYSITCESGKKTIYPNE